MKWGILATGKIAHTFAGEYGIPLAFGSYEELAAAAYFV